MSAIVLRGDARQLPLPDASVDLIVTSPPYFAMRSYTDAGAVYDGQIGSEYTPWDYLDALVECTAEWMRVLKPSGSMFVNLGDKYSTYTGANWGNGRSLDGFRGQAKVPHGGPVNAPKVYGIPYKSLMGLPWRYALRCVDDLGLILRRDIIWEKLNSLPESVNDRCRSSHEYIFHFTRQPRYYAAIDTIRLPADTPRRALRAPLSPVTQGQEITATVSTDDGVLAVQGVCQLGSLSRPVEAPMAGNAQGLQIVEPVGFSLRIELGERAYVADLQPRRLPAALDAPMPIAIKDALTQFLPAGTTPRAIPAAPSGILLAGSVVPDAWRRAKVTRLDCALCPPEGLAARIALDLDPGEATLLVWNSFGATHEISLPNGSMPLGRLPGSVWSIPSQPLTVPAHLGVDHFAAFPMELPRRCVLGWSPPGICVACGEGRRPVVVTAYVNDRSNKRPELRSGFDRHMVAHRKPTLSDGPGATTITGYACACPTPDAPTRPAVVADPFGGTGTTAMTADVLGRTGISIDRSMDYGRLAMWRTRDPGERARALGVPKPPPVPRGQAELDFGGVA